MVPSVNVIYVKSIHQTRFGYLGEKFCFNRFGKILWANPRCTRVSFGDKSSAVAVHYSCICGLLFCSMRFFLFAETSSFYGAPWHHGNHDKVLESVDNNEIHLNPNSCLYLSRKRYATNRFPSLRMPLLFKKLFSFSNSAFSRRRRRSSSIISNWNFSSSLFWHSSRTSVPSWKQLLWICRTQLQGWQSCVRLECAHEQPFIWFRLIFESCVFLLCWHYDLAGRGVTNSLYHNNLYNLNLLL